MILRISKLAVIGLGLIGLAPSALTQSTALRCPTFDEMMIVGTCKQYPGCYTRTDPTLLASLWCLEKGETRWAYQIGRSAQGMKFGRTVKANIGTAQVIRTDDLTPDEMEACVGAINAAAEALNCRSLR